MREIKEGMTLKFNGAADANNGTTRFYLDRGEPADQNLEVFVGDTVTVGKDITKNEASQLLRNSAWKFEITGE